MGCWLRAVRWEDGEAPDPGSLYRALRSLEDDGVVCSSWDTSNAGPAQRVYELTDLGDGVFAHLAALYHLAMPESLANELGLKMLHTLPDSEITVTVDVKPVWEKKLAAIACHRTQAGESPILHAPLARQVRFLGWEHFHLFSVSVPAGRKMANLEAWISCR